jgi:hypothetical protein
LLSDIINSSYLQSKSPIKQAQPYPSAFSTKIPEMTPDNNKIKKTPLKEIKKSINNINNETIINKSVIPFNSLLFNSTIDKTKR